MDFLKEYRSPWIGFVLWLAACLICLLLTLAAFQIAEDAQSQCTAGDGGRE